MERCYIYIMLSNTFTWTTRAIGLYTKAPYNHVSLALDKELNSMYSFGRRRPEWPLPGGLVQEKPYEGTYARFKNTLCAIYQLEISWEEYEAVKAAIADFLKEQNRYSFNLLGFAGLAAGLPIERPYAYFCSQFVSTVLEKGGIRLVDKPPGLVRPSDFPNNAKLSLIYEGRLADYKSSDLAV